MQYAVESMLELCRQWREEDKQWRQVGLVPLLVQIMPAKDQLQLSESLLQSKQQSINLIDLLKRLPSLIVEDNMVGGKKSADKLILMFFYGARTHAKVL